MTREFQDRPPVIFTFQKDRLADPTTVAAGMAKIDAATAAIAELGSGFSEHQRELLYQIVDLAIENVFEATVYRKDLVRVGTRHPDFEIKLRESANDMDIHHAALRSAQVVNKNP